MDSEKVHLLVSACINYGHLGYWNLDDQELIYLYNECLVISQYIGDTLSIVQLQVLLGELKEKMNCFEESANDLNMKLKVSERNGKMVALAFLLMAERHSLLCNVNKAIDCCKKAISISKNLGIKDIEGNAYHSLADIYGHLGKHHEMMECAENCLKIAKETRNKKLEGSGYLRLGAAYFGLGKWDEAISSSEESIKIAGEIDKKSILRDANSLIGNAYKNLHNPEQALRFLERSLETGEEVGDRNAHDEIMSLVRLGRLCSMSGKYQEAITYYQKGLAISLVIGDKYKQGNLYTDLGVLYMALGKLNESMQCLEKGLDVFKEIRNREKEGEVYLCFAEMYNTVGKYQDALENLNNSLEIAIETGNNRRQIDCYGYLGSIYYNLKEYEIAEEYLVKSLDCTRQTGDKRGEGQTCKMIGVVLSALYNAEEAMEYLEESLAIAISINDKEGEGHSYHHLGEAYFRMKRYDEVIKYEEKSINIANDIGSQKMAGYAYNALGSVHYRLSIVFDEEGDEEKSQNAKQKSEENLKHALQCWEWQFRHLKDLHDFKISIVDTFIKTYKLLTKVLIKRQKPEEALLISDRGRARSLGNILFSRYDITIQTAPSQVPIDSTDLERVLSSNQFCILFFAMVDEDLYAWVLTHQKPIVLVTNNNQALAVEKALNKFYLMKEMQATRCENRSFESTKDSKQPNDSSKVQSVERNVDPVGEPQTNVTEPTTNQLEVLFSLLVTVDHHSKTGALIVGDPDVGQVTLKDKTKTFERLPSAEREAILIGKLLDVTPLTGSQATKEMVKKKLQESGVAVIHIAAHGDSEHGHIALAPPPRTKTTGIPEEQDYMLTMQEVQEIGVTAQLVVLSCCHSGRGDIKAEGVVGMSRAFLAAGARAVVASLWDVDDEATLSFMLTFYTFLKMGESASKSLQKAMDDIRGEEGYEDPKYWAPFFLIGDDVTISV